MTDVDKQTRTSALARRVTTTAAAWLAAYVVVTLVVVAGGPTLAGAPRSVQTLIISGALVTVMINAVMPAISGVVGRLFRSNP